MINAIVFIVLFAMLFLLAMIVRPKDLHVLYVGKLDKDRLLGADQYEKIDPFKRKSLIAFCIFILIIINKKVNDIKDNRKNKYKRRHRRIHRR